MPETCVCGHAKDDHKMVVRARDGKELYCGHCDKCDYGPPVHGCHRFRPVLKWPDSDGFWWINNWEMCWFHEGQVWLTGEPEPLERDLFEAHAREFIGDDVWFANVIEKNPFEAYRQ